MPHRDSRVIARLRRAVATLLAPGRSTAEWSASSVEALKALVQARQATLLVAGDGRHLVAGDEVPASVLRRWRDVGGAATTRPRAAASPAASAVPAAWDDEPPGRSDAFDADAGASDPASDALPGHVSGRSGWFRLATPAASGRTVAALYVEYAEPLTVAESEDRLELLRVVRPAFEAAMQARAARGERAGLLVDLLHGIDGGAALLTRTGELVEANAALRAMLRQEPEAPRLERALALAATLVPGTPQAATVDAPAVSTAAARYRIRVCVPRSTAERRTDLVLVLAQRCAARPLTRDAARRAFGLTDRECDVADLLRLGRSNAEVAVALGISPFTARRHTERVLMKLGVPTRAGVAGALASMDGASDGAMDAPRADAPSRLPVTPHADAVPARRERPGESRPSGVRTADDRRP